MEEQGATPLVHGRGWSSLEGHYRRAELPVGPSCWESDDLQDEVEQLRTDKAQLEQELHEMKMRFKETLDLGYELATQRNTFIERLAASENSRRALQQEVQARALHLAAARTLFQRDRSVIAAANRESQELHQTLQAVRNAICALDVNVDVASIKNHLLDVLDETDVARTTIVGDSGALEILEVRDVDVFEASEPETVDMSR